MANKEMMEVTERISGELTKIVKGGGKWYQILDKVSQVVVKHTETIGASWEGTDKKKFAMDVVDFIWFKHLNLKKVPDFLERPVVRFIADKAIEAAVSLFNRTGVFAKTDPV